MAGVVRLEAGANTSLTSLNPLLKEIVIGFGWNIVQPSGPATELVPSAVMCDANNVAISDESLIFFNQLSTPDDAVRYVTNGDAEQIEVNLALVPEVVEKIVFIVYVDPDVRRPGNFGSVRSAYIRVSDSAEDEMVRFDVAQANTDVTAMVFGELYRYKGQWKFRAVGQGYSTGLVGVAKDFKVNL